MSGMAENTTVLQNTTDSVIFFPTVQPSKALTTSQIFVIVRSTLLLFFLVVGVFGNTLVLVAYKTTPRLWTKSNMLVASFASVGFLETGPTLLYHVTYQLLVYVFNNDPCKYRMVVAIFTPLQRIPTKMIEFHLFLLTIERYIAIAYPLHYEARITEDKVRIAIASCWTYGFIFGVFSYCWLISTNWSSCGSAYPVILFGSIDIGTFSLTVATLIGIYGRIFFIAMKHRLRIDAVEAQFGNLSESSGQSTEAGVSKRNALKKQRKAFKSTVMTLTIVCPFVVAWLPITAGRIMFVSGNQTNYVRNILDIGLALGVACQATDWMIYGFTNRDFRRAFKRILISRSLSATGNMQ